MTNRPTNVKASTSLIVIGAALLLGGTIWEALVDQANAFFGIILLVVSGCLLIGGIVAKAVATGTKESRHGGK